MSWLERELTALEGVASEVEAGQDPATLRSACTELVERIASRQGVRACFVARDGLLMSAAGQSEGLEGLAAIAGACSTEADRGARLCGLGSLTQLLVVGASGKLVVIRLARFVVGICSGIGVCLQEALRD